MGYEVSGVSVCGSRYRADFRWRNEDGSLSPRIRRMLSGTDRESAVEEAEWMALHDLSPISDSSISLGEAIEEYIASKEGEVSPLTAKGYRGSLGKIARASRRIVAMPLRELEPSHIRNYEDVRLRKGVSPNTVRKEHSLIAAALDAAVASVGIRRNPAREVSPPLKSACARGRCRKTPGARFRWCPPCRAGSGCLHPSRSTPGRWHARSPPWNGAISTAGSQRGASRGAYRPSMGWSSPMRNREHSKHPPRRARSWIWPMRYPVARGASAPATGCSTSSPRRWRVSSTPSPRSSG